MSWVSVVTQLASEVRANHQVKVIEVVGVETSLRGDIPVQDNIDLTKALKTTLAKRILYLTC
jgi:hypothetical protein